VCSGIILLANTNKLENNDEEKELILKYFSFLSMCRPTSIILLPHIVIASTLNNNNNRMSFGFHRAEVIGALSSVLLIWVVTAVLFYMAVLRVVNPDFDLDTTIMLISSSIGIVVNVM
jgi:Co/Zn/Cd efflux system component